MTIGERKSIWKRRESIRRVLLAQLKALETKRQPEVRQASKIRLIKGLYQRGLDADDIRQLFRLIDWMLKTSQGTGRRVLD